MSSASLMEPATQSRSLLESDSNKVPPTSDLLDILNDEVAQTKLLASLILFVITLLCGYLPVRILLNQNYIQYAMFAGGGVLMATAFCHLIPEAHDNYKLISAEFLSQGERNNNHNHHHSHHALNNNNDNNSLLESASNSILSQLVNSNRTSHGDNLLPGADSSQLTLATVTGTTNNLTNNHNNNDNINNTEAGLFAMAGGLNIPYLEVTLCCGFFFMYLVEQLMVRFINNHSHNHRVSVQAQAGSDSSIGQLVVPISGSETLINDNPRHRRSATGVLVVDATNGGGGGGGDTAITGTNPSAGGTSVNLSSVDSVNSAATSSSSDRIGLRRGRTGSGGGGAGAPLAGSKGNEFYKFMRGLLIVSAFGAHSIFDGVAIGSQFTVDKVWTIFLAISCHKLIIAAVVGLELYSATLESHLWTLVHLTIFSIMSPIGIVLVVIAQGTLHIDSNHPAMILLQSFATGTLLYIVFVEILQPKEDQVYEKNKFGKSLSLIAGFALMVTILTIMDE